jgi:hypothetical protein
MSVYLSQALSLTQAPTIDNDAGIIGYDNLLTISNVSATSAAVDYPATNLANPSTASFWRSAITTTQYVLINTVGTASYIGLARHNLGTVQAIVSVEALNDSTWETVFDEKILADDATIIFRFAETSAGAFRLKIQNAIAVPQISILYIGELLELQRRIYVGHTPITYGRQTTVQSGRSENGNYLGRVILQERLSTSVQLENLTPNWYRETMEPFVITAKSLPFFYSWRPTTYPEEVGFCWLTNDAIPVNQRSNGMMSINLEMGGFAL